MEREDSAVSEDKDLNEDVAELIKRPTGHFQVMSSVRGFAPWLVYGNGLEALIFGFLIYVPYMWIVGDRRGHVVGVYRQPRHFGFPRPVAMSLVPTEADADRLTEECVEACRAGVYDEAPKLGWFARRQLLGVSLGALLSILLLLGLMGIFVALTGLASATFDAVVDLF